MHSAPRGTKKVGTKPDYFCLPKWSSTPRGWKIFSNLEKLIILLGQPLVNTGHPPHSLFLFLKGGKSFTNCKNLSFYWTNSPITPRFGSTIRSSYLLKPLNIYSYLNSWTGRYTGGAVRPKKEWFYVFLSLIMEFTCNFEGSGGIYFQGYII